MRSSTVQVNRRSRVHLGELDGGAAYWIPDREHAVGRVRAGHRRDEVSVRGHDGGSGVEVRQDRRVVHAQVGHRTSGVGAGLQVGRRHGDGVAIHTAVADDAAVPGEVEHHTRLAGRVDGQQLAAPVQDTVHEQRVAERYGPRSDFTDLQVDGGARALGVRRGRRQLDPLAAVGSEAAGETDEGDRVLVEPARVQIDEPFGGLVRAVVGDVGDRAGSDVEHGHVGVQQHPSAAHAG